MFALKQGYSGRPGGKRLGLFGMSFSADGFVLPRLLRKPVRMLGRMFSGEVEAPRFAATIMTATFLGASSAYGAYLGGHMPSVVQAVTARTGFAVDQIRVLGYRQTSEIDILDKLELDGWTSLIGFSADAARTRIADLPWVQEVSVRKVYPNTIEVKIEERDAFAVWQQGSQLSVIESSGRIIAPFVLGRHTDLPLLVGYGAADDGAAFIARVKKFPELASKARGYIRVAQRRWNIRLDNGVTVKLPEQGEERAMAALVAMDKENGLLSRDIAAVDMRLDDRVVVQLTEEAAEKREAALKELMKPGRKPAEKRI